MRAPTPDAAPARRGLPGRPVHGRQATRLSWKTGPARTRPASTTRHGGNSRTSAASFPVPVR
ncbi:MAG: DUF1472 domain-containing protein [Thiobacillus sp.]|nr:DUF1472 domain-containing protein [Thiobacillus sp.]